MCAQSCHERAPVWALRTICAASRALSCELIKKRTSRLRLERGAGALLSHRVGQSGQGSPLRIRRPHSLRSRAGACSHYYLQNCSHVDLLTPLVAGMQVEFLQM
jgi:hypothetical protein